MVADCAQCHIMGNKPDTRYLHQGPTLWSMEGVARASDKSYDYSMTLRRYGGVWDLDSLNWIMAAPAVAFPGTHKNWYPITDPQIRAHVVAYLRSLGPPPD
jgi:cytochrome c